MSEINKNVEEIAELLIEVRNRWDDLTIYEKVKLPEAGVRLFAKAIHDAGYCKLESLDEEKVAEFINEQKRINGAKWHKERGVNNRDLSKAIVLAHKEGRLNG